jgi:hypothetical protein
MIFDPGWGWACRPRKVMKIGWSAECVAGSGEIEISHGASEAETLIDPERA